MNCIGDVPSPKDCIVVMPNHLHGVVIINQTPTDKSWIMMKDSQITLGKIIREYKARTCRMIRVKGFDSFKWQRSYYDHVVRNERSLNRIREYIKRNPQQWTLDKGKSAYQDKDKFNRWLNEEGKQNITTRKIL